jgi:adenosine deaminase
VVNGFGYAVKVCSSSPIWSKILQRYAVEHRPSSHRSIEFYQSLPKVELHRHLEGSLRLETLVEVAQQHGIAEGRLLSQLVQVSRSEPHTIQNFLSKFETLRLFYRTPEIIGRITREVITDAAADNVRYLELRFTPAALCKARGFAMAEVIDWVIAGMRQAQTAGGPITRLIVSINRHEPPALAEQAIQLAAERMSLGVVGIDVAGNEADHADLERFAGMLAEAHRAGLGLTIHAGEWGGAENVAQAINRYQADRIGHGVRVMEDAAVVAQARDAGIPFEVCLTSNLQSGVAASLPGHPFRRMLAAGLNIMLNTDDPSISQITLGHEYQLACEELGIPLAVLKQCLLAGAQAAFLAETEREALSQRLGVEFDRAAAAPDG